MRRQFELGEGDEEGLNAKGLPWETVVEANTKWLILNDYPIPLGYNTRTAIAALRIPPSYPDDQIDMIYFHPSLALASGRAIGQLTPFTLDQKQFQQWSRHRTAANPWRPGIDNICTHLLQADHWLARELKK